MSRDESTASWVRLAEAHDLASGQGRAFDVAGRRLALFHDRDRFYCIDDRCPHEGASLATGTLFDGRVICPLHAWVFDLATGRCPRETHEAVTAYPTRCVGGTVEVCLSAPGIS